MCSDIAIRVRNVSKTYKVVNDEERQNRGWRRLFSFGSRAEYIQALKDVSFEVYRGETLGIIGRNGAGKSTLLRVIAGITEPDSGSVEVNGTIAPVLALQAGFNAQRTGRENLYLKGAVMGLTREEIDNRFDSIAAFADIGEFMDQPLRTYSSGMRARLAFAVAFHTDPEILIVDETLAVGDEIFRRKCMDRIATIKDSNAAVLFVTHGYGVLPTLCDRGLLLDKGERLLVGKPKLVVEKFQELVYADASESEQVRKSIQMLDRNSHSETPRLRKINNAQSDAAVALVEGEGDEGFVQELARHSGQELSRRGANVLAVVIRNELHQRVNLLRPNDVYEIGVAVAFGQPAREARVELVVKTVEGIRLWVVEQPIYPDSGGALLKAGARYDTTFRFRNCLVPGLYFVDVTITGNVGDREIVLHGIRDAVIFQTGDGKGCNGQGLIDLSVKMEKLKEQDSIKKVKAS